MIRTVRVYEMECTDRGRRYLVDRLWPRGVAKESLPLSGWLPDVAPSDGLRRWFGHDVSRWEEFRRRYTAELDDHPDAWAPLRDAAREGDVLLLYTARDREHNNAVVLGDYLARQLRGRPMTSPPGTDRSNDEGARDDADETGTSAGRRTCRSSPGGGQARSPRPRRCHLGAVHEAGVGVPAGPSALRGHRRSGADGEPALPAHRRDDVGQACSGADG
jgi:uncharacterized protein YeaO (DUF488 family)